MAIEYGRFMVRPGAEVNVTGHVYGAGVVLQLERHIAMEIRHLVFEVDASDLPIESPDAFDAAVEPYRPHERVTLIEQEIARLEGRISDLRARLAGEAKALETIALPVRPRHVHDAEPPAVIASAPADAAPSSTTADDKPPQA